MTAPSAVAGLVLAAGAGRRLGGPKALVELAGELLVDRAVRTLRAGGCDPIVVVLGADADRVTAAADLEDAVVVVNADWLAGMGSSLRAGLATVSDLGAEAVVVTLVDQPAITSRVIDRLVAVPADALAVAASYGGRRGNPVRLSRPVWSEVSHLAVGDNGARAWLRSHGEEVLVVACDDLGHDRDVDTAHDLEHVEEWV